MKLLYIAPTIIELDNLDGVAKKILSHMKIFSKNYEAILLYRDKEAVSLYRYNIRKNEVIRKGYSKYDILISALKIIDKENVDYCYIRYPRSDMFFLRVLKKLKSNNTKVTVEIPTYPYDNEGAVSLKGRIITLVDKIYRKKIHSYVDRIITYSEDDRIFGIKTIRTVNGIDFERVSIATQINENNIIHMCGVATFHQIHGYDRLIKGLRDYYRNGGTRLVIFDVVGYGDNCILQDYKDMVEEYGLTDNVVFYGRLQGTRLDAVYENATIGVNSLAIHREKLERESTLKTREYAAKGLPILSSSVVDAFSPEDNKKYVCMVPADDTPIDIKKVIDFCDTLYSNTKLDELRHTIRNKAQCICDMQVTLNKVIEFYENDIV